MNLFDNIKRLFGEGAMRFDFRLEDGSEGTIRVPYIGSRYTMDQSDINNLKQDLYRRLGSRCIYLKML